MEYSDLLIILLLIVLIIVVLFKNDMNKLISIDSTFHKNSNLYSNIKKEPELEYQNHNYIINQSDKINNKLINDVNANKKNDYTLKKSKNTIINSIYNNKNKKVNNKKIIINDMKL